MRHGFVVKALLVTGLGLWFVAPRAHAYIDPGIGSYLLQVVLGVFVGGMFLIKSYWHKLRAALSGRGDDDRHTEAPSEPSH